MTMPHEPNYEHAIEPLPVVVHEMPHMRWVRKSGSYITVAVPATTNVPIPISPEHPDRCRVVLWADAKVLIGDRDEILAGKGATVPANGYPIEITHNEDIYAAPVNATPANVSVIIERYTT